MKTVSKYSKKVCIVIVQWWRKLNLSLDKNSSVLGAWASLLTILGIPLLLLGGFSTWLQVKEYINRPEIELYLENSKNVNFRLINYSSVLLREPQYSFSLWDLDARKEGVGDDPGNLVIPVKTLNYIRPKSGIGPFTIEGLSKASEKVPNGHIVFGWASVQCPDCVSRKDYWILIKKGEIAWYSKIEAEEKPLILRSLSVVLESGKNYPKLISKIVPLKDRIHVIDSFMKD